MANSDIYNQLKQLFEGIRDERSMHANTAERIGNAFLSLLSYAEAAGSGGTGDGSGGTGGDCCGLKKEIPVGVTVGMLDKGARLHIGMSCEDIFRRMLYKVDPATMTASLSHANDVEFGMTKGTITYTATQNASGPLEKAETEAAQNVLSNFIQGKWVRDLKTISDDGDKYIKDKYTFTLGWKFGNSADFPTGTSGTSTISVNVRRKWFAGVVAKAPATSEEVRALTSGGLYTGSGKYSFQAEKGWRMIAICLPGNVTIKNLETEKKDGNYAEESDWRRAGSVQVEGANGSKSAEYSVYTFGPTPADNDGFTFTFEV